MCDESASHYFSDDYHKFCSLIIHDHKISTVSACTSKTTLAMLLCAMLWCVSNNSCVKTEHDS